MSQDKCTSGDMPCLLLPIFLVSLTMAGFFGFQSYQVLKEKTSLELAYHQQEEPLKAVDNMSKQMGGLITGMKKLMDQGNPHAKEIMEKLVAETQMSARSGNRGAMFLLDRMISGGILRVEKPGEAGNAAEKAPVPAASEPATRGPVKP